MMKVKMKLNVIKEKRGRDTDQYEGGLDNGSDTAHKTERRLNDSIFLSSTPDSYPSGITRNLSGNICKCNQCEFDQNT